MFFIFKKKKLILDCFTTNNNAYEYAPISKAIKYLPDWWKNTPKEVDVGGEKNIGTIKSCSAFIDFYKNGIVLPSWFEMEVTINPVNSDMYWTYTTSDPNTMLENFHHSIPQFQGFAEQNMSNLKINSPWRFRTNRSVNFAWTAPLWNNKQINPYLQILPGCLNFHYQNATHINYCVINDDKSHTVSITPKMPLAMLHPLTEDEVEIKNHLVSDTEWNKISSIYSLFLRHTPSLRHSLYKRKKEIINSENKSKCPFGFGK
jgi:hypothetical protein